MRLPHWQDITDASNRIAMHVHKTPVLTCNSINSITGSTILFKCENFQKTGAFKFRGATNAVLLLTESNAGSGVATHSSGNHAAALASAAAHRGIKAHIVMPGSAPEIKKRAVLSYGAEVTYCSSDIASREKSLKLVTDSTGAFLIHPYNNFEVICGQGTAAFEFIKEVADLDIIITPVGGGGLLSGTSIISKHLNKSIRVIGAEPLLADDAYRSIKTGRVQPPLPPATIADGLLTGLCDLTFNIIDRYVDEIVCVTENSIVAAMQMVWERMKIIIEPSSAVPLAVVLENKAMFAGKRTGIIISGGNVDLLNLPFGKFTS